MNESSPNVKHITQAEFADEVTRCAQPVVVDFYATWCGPCQELAPVLDHVAGGYAGKIKFVKVNVDESPGIAQNYQADALPVVLLFKDGTLADRISGVPTEADLKTNLDALVSGK
jgi:thioredoxin 1